MGNGNITAVLNFDDNTTSSKEICARTLESLIPNKNKVVFACVGTDKSVGDCLGPWIGTELEKRGFEVVGTLKNPLHALNIPIRVPELKNKYKGYTIIAIDACLGYEGKIGQVQIKNDSIHPGKGVGKTLPYVGDVAIVGVVDLIENADIFSLKSIRLSFVLEVADRICEIIDMVFNSSSKKEAAADKYDKGVKRDGKSNSRL
jgi:putative sporulation protein YyaC